LALSEQGGVVGDAAGVTTVLIVDDHVAFTDLFAIALANEPDFEVVGTASTAEAAVALAQRTRPALVVMDINLGGQDGLAATRRIRELLPETIVVVISAHREPTWVARAAGAGANAFAPKTGSLSEMLWVLRHARTESMLVAPSQLRMGAGRAAESSVDALTDRERDVLALMGTGRAPVQIARELHISVHTCRGHVKSIHNKLGARSQLEAVVKAQRLGLIDFAETRTA
jgi:DNA-binding NarL/FixJ family response regulator